MSWRRAIDGHSWWPFSPTPGAPPRMVADAAVSRLRLTANGDAPELCLIAEADNWWALVEGLPAARLPPYVGRAASEVETCLAQLTDSVRRLHHRGFRLRLVPDRTDDWPRRLVHVIRQAPGGPLLLDDPARWRCPPGPLTLEYPKRINRRGLNFQLAGVEGWRRQLLESVWWAAKGPSADREALADWCGMLQLVLYHETIRQEVGGDPESALACARRVAHLCQGGFTAWLMARLTLRGRAGWWANYRGWFLWAQAQIDV